MSKEEFDQAVRELIEHCGTLQVRCTSSLNLVNCDASRKILSMGYEALPLIRRLYDEDSSNNFALRIIQGHGLSAIVRRIVHGDLSIPESMKGRISEIQDYTKHWLDQNMQKYIPGE